MAVMKQVVGARTALTTTGFSSLAAGTYLTSEAVTAATNSPTDVIVEVRAATTGTPSGNKQVLVFAKESLNGSIFRSGPINGTSTTEEGNLKFLGVLPMPTSGSVQMATFSIVQAFGYCPHSLYIVVKNDLGVALTFGEIAKAEISVTVT